MNQTLSHKLNQSCDMGKQSEVTAEVKGEAHVKANITLNYSTPPPAALPPRSK